MEFKFCMHSQISSKELRNIIELKNIHWKYTVDQHLSWIKENILDADIHVTMYKNNKLLGYLNLVVIKVKLNNKDCDIYGIGNVCSRENGYGYGKELLIGIQQYLIENDCRGILFCKNALVPFYKKFGWDLI